VLDANTSARDAHGRSRSDLVGCEVRELFAEEGEDVASLTDVDAGPR
jgi:hypothetical protein